MDVYTTNASRVKPKIPTPCPLRTPRRLAVRPYTFLGWVAWGQVCIWIGNI